MNMYLFVYDLMQFCGHSWIFTNMMIRFMTFGKDSLADTFYSIGLVMRLCQLLSVLEILHILVGIDKSRLLPRFLQITERIIVLFVVINSQEEVQGKYVVCVLFFLWNLLDVIRYTYNMLARMGIYYLPLTWLNFSLCILLYPLSVLAKGFAICVSLPYFESFGTYSIKLPFPFAFSIYFPYVLKMYLPVLFIGKCFILQKAGSQQNWDAYGNKKSHQCWAFHKLTLPHLLQTTAGKCITACFDFQYLSNTNSDTPCIWHIKA
ncbi:very-long-chain (3R)-3-hydroxyacyl-CoA dehydratase 4 isoform X1 [Malurus melanocephalus]|uniref:very-long-chain (3R)-3-hydroxyacyl-CoA dehydratase 4 isoform X1 n=1 Tax=Malurus melanocephalus TaxID=175006 RepID=UPI0025487107|nr:very-long-chain (3R)-3-hydroxyacyl-CoA dehydratase 4 isoform X1 [Malurus melanocephalus]